MPRKRSLPAVPRQALLLGGLTCPVPECGGMREPRTDGNGYVRDVCDRCAARVREVRLLRRHIARLTGQEPPPLPLHPVRADATAATPAVPPAQPVTVPGATARPDKRPNGRPRGTSAAILDVLATATGPLLIDEIYPRVAACHPTTRGSVAQLLYQLVQRGAIAASARDRLRPGAPKRYTLPPRAATETAP